MSSVASASIVETQVTGGYSKLRSAPVECSFDGISLSVVDVEIPEYISYAQHSRGHLMLATLSAWRPGWENRRLRQSVSVAPAGIDRKRTVRRLRLSGAMIAVEPWRLDEACEQRLGHDWQSRRDVDDGKAAALARFAAAAAARADALACETLLHSAARHLGKVYAGASMRRDDGWLPPPALIRIIDRLRSDQPVTLTDLANEAGLGVSAFMRAFRGSTGKTPMAFALELRLDRALRLLTTTDMTVGEIAGACRFSSASHLIRLCRERRGFTPAQGRKLGLV